MSFVFRASYRFRFAGHPRACCPAPEEGRNLELILLDGALLRRLAAMRIQRALRRTRSLGRGRPLAIFLVHGGRTLWRPRGEILLRRLLGGTRRGRLFLLVGPD